MSNGLSSRHKGIILNKSSKLSEKTLIETLPELTSYIETLFIPLGYNIIHRNKITLFECQKYFNNAGGRQKPNPQNDRSYMIPDGGIFYAVKNGIEFPILVIEDKIQGTNDNRFCENKNKQSTGNAIERSAKNIRLSEMLFADMDIFPYVIFASGCDFHTTETISQRLVSMNMGHENHYINIDNKTTQDDIYTCLDNIKKCISIKKDCNIGIASIFVKGHKYNEMANGSSLWKKDERLHILQEVINKVYDTFL